MRSEIMKSSAIEKRIVKIDQEIQAMNIAKKYLNRGVCAIDLAGDEAHYPTGDFIDLFKASKDYGIPYADIKDIAGGEAEENAKIIIDILNGKKGPQRDIVVLNAGAGFFAGKITDSIEEGIALANKLLDDGTALAKYNELKEA